MRTRVRTFINQIGDLSGVCWMKCLPICQILAASSFGHSLRKAGAKKTWQKDHDGVSKVAPMSVADFLNEKFETNFIKGGHWQDPPSMGPYTGPWSSYYTLNLFDSGNPANECVVGGTSGSCFSP